MNETKFQTYDNRKKRLTIEDFEDFDHNDFDDDIEILSYDTDNDNVVDSDDCGVNQRDRKKKRNILGTFHNNGYNVWRIN